MSRPSLLSDRAPIPEAAPAPEALELRIEALEFELQLSRRIQDRLESEIQRLHHHIAALEADRASIRNRLDERERYVAGVHASVGWKALQWVRGLVGRRW